MILEFLITSSLVIASPGPGVLLTLSASLSRGAKAGIVTAAGCSLGILPHAAAAMTGLAALLHASAILFQTVRIAGVAYLLVVAWLTLRERDKAPAVVPTQATSPQPGTPAPIGRTIVAAAALNLLNPKLSLFFLAFLPQFLSADDPAPVLTMALLSLAFIALTFAMFAGYAVGAAVLRDRLLRRPAALLWLRRAMAACFVGLAARLALASR